MELKEGLKYLDVQIKKIEQMNYYFETVMLPRFEQDRKICERMREHYIKMQALLERSERGEQISPEEIQDAIPKNFR